MKGGDSWLKAGKSSLWKEASKERLRVRREHAPGLDIQDVLMTWRDGQQKDGLN